MARKSSTNLEMDIDYHGVVLKMGGEITIILRPAHINYSEWMTFWGGSEPHYNGTRQNFTHEEALYKHQKFIASR